MLPAAHRLRRSVDFERTVRRGTRAGRSTVVVHLLEKARPSDSLIQVSLHAGSAGYLIVIFRPGDYYPVPISHGAYPAWRCSRLQSVAYFCGRNSQSKQVIAAAFPIDRNRNCKARFS